VNDTKKMSAQEAVGILMEMMKDKTLGIDRINAINMGINQIMRKYRGRMINLARRFENARGAK